MTLRALMGNVDARRQLASPKVVQRFCLIFLILIMCISDARQAKLTNLKKSLEFLPVLAKEYQPSVQTYINFDTPKTEQIQLDDRLKDDAHEDSRGDIFLKNVHKTESGEQSDKDTAVQVMSTNKQSDEDTVVQVMSTGQPSEKTALYQYGTTEMKEADDLQSTSRKSTGNWWEKRPATTSKEEEAHFSTFRHAPRGVPYSNSSKAKDYGTFLEGSEKSNLHNMLSGDGMATTPHRGGGKTNPCPPCKCRKLRGSETADCSRLQLAGIPETLPHGISSLNMSLNLVSVFNYTLISMYPYLEDIDFHSNSIQTFQIGIYNISQLIQLNLKNNSLSKLGNIGCKCFPKLQVLILSKNNISHIPSSTFKDCRHLTYLDLSQNRVTSIDSSAFDSLSSLLTLSLAFNLDFKYTVLTPRLFRELVHLRQLAIQGCDINNLQYPNEALATISGLVELSIDGLGGGVEFGSAISKLTHLESVNFSPGSFCSINSISSSFFENIRYIKSVSFNYCRFYRIDPKSLKVLHNLEAYAISLPMFYNLSQAFDDIKGLQKSPLKSLKLTKFKRRNTPCLQLTFQEGRYLQEFPLEELDLSSNDVAEMDDSFLEAIPKTLQVFKLQWNKFNFFPQLWGGMTSFKALRILDLSSQNRWNTVFGASLDSRQGRQVNKNYLQSYSSNQDWYHFANRGESNDYDTYEHNDSEMLLDVFEGEENNDEERLSTHLKWKTGQMNLYLPPNLTTLISSKFPYDSQILFFTNIISPGLKEILLSKSILSSWGRGVMPVTIETADLSENYCDAILPSFVPPNSSLRHLFIQRNYLGPSLTEDFNGDIFANAKRMRVLDMSQNIIFNLPKQFLRGLQHLQRLILIENKLHIIDINFSYTPNLRFLDLRRNSIIWISQASRNDLDLIASRHVLTIDLTDNPLPCTCHGLELLRWMVRTNAHLHNRDRMMCSAQNKKVKELMGDIQRKINELEGQCASKYIVIVSAFLGVFISLIITLALLYKHRWKLIYMRNVWLVTMYGFRPMGKTPTGCIYDAYVVYCQKDRNFALDTMLEELEEKRGHKLCVEDRDFIPGSFNFNNITCAVQNSTITLLLMSPDFLREKEHEYATQMALMEEYNGKTKRDILLLLNYKSTDHKELSQDLLMLMRKGRFLDFPRLGEEEGEAEEMPESIISAFWDRLSGEIGHVENRNASSPLFVNVDRPAI